jgi:hypothetical protein
MINNEMIKPNIEKALFYNRDENSFTARLFEGILFPKFYNRNDEFVDFIKTINNANKRCRDIIKQKAEENVVATFSIPIELNLREGCFSWSVLIFIRPQAWVMMTKPNLMFLLLLKIP